MGDRLADQMFRLGAGPFDAENGHERSLSGRRVATGRLTGLFAVAFDVEKVVRSLR